MPAKDPRRILEITDQYRQYGPWGIRVPSGGTIYFNTKEEADKYMEEHPWSATNFKELQEKKSPERRARIEERVKDALEPPIPPTSAPCINYPCQLPKGHAGRCSSDQPESQPQQDALLVWTVKQCQEHYALLEAERDQLRAALTQAREALRRIADEAHEPMVWARHEARAALAATQPKP